MKRIADKNQAFGPFFLTKLFVSRTGILIWPKVPEGRREWL
jgi:hypothetical protein